MIYLLAALIAGIAVVGGIVFSILMTKWHIPVPWVRKISHLGAMLVIILGAYFFGYHLMIIVGIVFAVLLLLIKLVRPPKALSTKEAKESYGEIFYFIGVALTATLAHSLSHFVIPIAILGLADTAAYVAGKSLHSPKLIFSKSMAGSTAFAVVAFVLFLFVLPWWGAGIGAILTAGVELVGAYGSDNIIIPVVASLILYI